MESDPTLVREVSLEDLQAVAKACSKTNVSHRQAQGGFIYPGKYYVATAELSSQVEIAVFVDIEI